MRDRAHSRTETALEPGESVRILHVDSDPEVLEMASNRLERASDRVTVVTETDPADAIERVGEARFDCVVSDYRLEGMDGVALLSAVREDYSDLPFVLFTGDAGERVTVEAVRADVTDFVPKGGGDEYATLAERTLEVVERHRTEQSGRARQRHYGSLLEHSRDVIAVLDEDGVFQYLSPGIEHSLGYEPTELVGEDAFSYIHPEDRAAVRQQFEAGTDNATTDTGRVEYRFRGPDGDYCWFESIGSSDFDARLGGYVVSSREITDRKERERELEQYETMLEAIPDGALMLDERGTMTHVNEAWADMVGYRREDLEDEPFRTLVAEGIIDEAVVDRYLETVKHLLSSGEEKATFTTKVIPPDDAREHVYEVHFSLLPSDDDEFRGSAGVVRDVTQKVRSRRELERQNERLEKFASVVSHDLRNPLDIALSRAELIRDEHGIDRAENLVDTLESMGDLVDDVLALARQGRVVDDPDRVDLDEVLADAADTVGVEERGATLTVEDLPTVQGDPQRIQSLFENLLTNAVVHAGGDGGVAIRVGAIPGADGRPAGFYVEDDGPGIPEDERDQVFEVGYTTADDGTGFGLNIVQEIAQAHDWSIAIDEGEDGGAKFEMTDVGTSDGGQ